ncbi:MAG: hypothetical protein PHU24_08815 [Sphaerochaetaceae bacterium]|nr:hypothetical protein [Sphaerochaetaceae bacterium]MDD3670382.1 hypothetical protein [Sphaerochaetaceae bacterium]MDD4258642.1 hypothetical protein [Sphaerochaetaceae bacterium]MDD4842250.1 hypothetical protein [Sphaerochaetaceae bacterium]
MKIQIMSKTKIGKWAFFLSLLFIVLMGLKALNIGFRIPFPSPIIAVFGMIGFVLGIISFLKNKDRSLSVLLSIPIGLLIMFWVAAEIAFPH